MKKIWNAIKNFFRSRTTEENVEAFILAAETASKFTATELDDDAAAKLRASKAAIVRVIDELL